MVCDIFSISCVSHVYFCICRYTYTNEVGYGSPYGYGTPVTPQAQGSLGYDISADYVDSTTAYEPRPGGGMLETDFIGSHS